MIQGVVPGVVSSMVMMGEVVVIIEMGRVFAYSGEVS